MLVKNIYYCFKMNEWKMNIFYQYNLMRYVILKQIVNEDGVYTQKIKNPIILSQLLEDYNVKYKSEYDK